MALVFIANTEFLKKLAGILKISELLLGMIVMSLCAHYTTLNNLHAGTRTEFFLLVASCTFFIVDFIMVISSLFSVNTEGRLRQTLFELMYHTIAFIFYFSGSVAVLAETTYHGARADAFLAAGGIGIVTSLLYAVSTYDSYRGYLTE